MLYANSLGHSLIAHLKAVANVAKEMAKHMGLSSDLVDVCYKAGLLHDLGKAMLSFQGYIAKTINPEQVLIIDDDFLDDPKWVGPLHHEVSWAYLTGKIGNDPIDKFVLDPVYWHHARPVHLKSKVSYDTNDAIMGALTTGDIQELDILYNALGVSGTGTSECIDVPKLFVKDGSLNRDDNAKAMLIRACVISSDRYVSSLCSKDVNLLSQGKVGDVIAQFLSGGVSGEPVKPEEYDQDRYDMQCGIVESATEQTTIVKAPAGMGKTLIGVLWARRLNKRVIWVCPRNAVADSVYENIVRELNVLGLSCSVELFRTGKVQKTNVDNGRKAFCSDIIVTNIDAIMSPMVNNGVADRLYTVYGCPVILDEFHEFVSDAPLFAAFVTYMRGRHRLSKSRTLLLSATPSIVQHLWDTTEKSSQILPDKVTHYPAAHKGVYEIAFMNSFPDGPTPGSLLVCNSVRNAQDNFSKGYTHIIHSHYTDKDRVGIMSALMESFGKGKAGVKNSESVSAALVVQAAMDISFRNLYDSMCSPESTLQRIGRTDRWGTFQPLHPRVTFIMPDDKSERCAVATVYNTGMHGLWVTYLKSRLSGLKIISLDELYCMYNEFYINYDIELKKMLEDLYREGMHGPVNREFLGLVSFKPVKVVDSQPNKKSKSSNRNLRSPDGSYFFVVGLSDNPNVWLSTEDIMSEGRELYELYSGNNALNLGLLQSGGMLTRLKGLVACGHLGWEKRVKGKAKIPDSLKDWFKLARNPETPLPDFSRRYDSVLGLVKIK